MLAALLFSCATADPLPPGHLAGPDLARRISFAVRGIPPRPDELARIDADPTALATWVDTWLESEEFLVAMRDYHADWLQLRTDSVPQLPAIGALAGSTTGQIYASTTEEPLQLVAHVLTERLPYTALLTVNSTFADETVAAIYGLPYVSGGATWQELAWTDGRPAAGLLSTGEVLLRWESNTGNYNRSRANFVADKLLCANFDDRDVLEPGIAGADDAEIASAVGSDPTCAACHQALDPLAAYFWGFRGIVHARQMDDAYDDGCDPTWDLAVPPEPGLYSGPDASCYPIRQYTPAYESTWDDYDLPPPGYYGAPVPDLGALAVEIASDRRFSQCVTRRLTGWLAHVPPEDVPDDVVLANEAVFLASDYDLRALVRAIVLSEPFARGPGDPADPFARMRTLRPEHYARTIDDLTGYRWEVIGDAADCATHPIYGNACWGTVDLLASDRWGFRSMMGGMDGYYATVPRDGATPARQLALDQVAWNAASAVVAADLALPEGDPARRLLTVGATASEGDVAAEVDRLFHRITGESPGLESAALAGLWVNQRDASSAADAWTAVVAALLLDPRMTYL